MIMLVDGLEPYQIESCKGYGCIPAKYMFVGISAGKLGALQTEIPFTKDMSGRLFQRALYHLGLSKTADEKTLKPDLVDCYVTNLVKGRILDEKGNNRLPTEKEVDYWIKPFIEEWTKVNPKVIIALGNFVYSALWCHCVAVTSLIKLKHPRAYGSRGAINKDSKAWTEMLADYQEALHKE